MRWFYCSVLILALAITAAGRAPGGSTEEPRVRTGGARQAAAGESAFKVFVRGFQVGTEQVAVSRSADGITITGSGRLAPPIDVVTNRCEMRYDAQWKPLEMNVDAIVRGDYTVLHTVFGDGTATSEVTVGGKQGSSTERIGNVHAVLLNSFFGLYEALTARLSDAKAGVDLDIFMPPQTLVRATLRSVSDERVQTPGQTIATRHYVLSIQLSLPMQVDVWGDERGRLVRIAIPSQSFEMVRADVATVAARRETVPPRAGDEDVRMPANGFSLAGTVSKPMEDKPGAKQRYPAVALVGESGPADRDQLAFGVPIVAQLASVLADAGFVVVRYDKRGVGQSGGRADSATLPIYADDARAVVRYLRDRKDVDPKRVAVVGYGDGGWMAMLASERNKDVAALALVATPGVNGADLVLEQQRHALDAMKLSPEERKAKIDLQKKIEDAALTGRGWNTIPPEYKNQADTPWFQSFLLFDPAKEMPSVRQPLLIVQGDLDQQVFAPQADRLAELAGKRKPPSGRQVIVAHLPGINHLLVRATTGEYNEYANLADKNVSKDVLSAVLSWLQQVLPPAR